METFTKTNDLESSFELPPPVIEENQKTRNVELTGTAAKYTTPAREPAEQQASSPTELAKTTEAIQTKPLSIHGAEHIFRDVQHFRPLDIYSNKVPSNKSKFGLEKDDKLVWDYVVVFDVPEEDDEHNDVLPYLNSKWAPPSDDIDPKNKKTSSKKKKTKKKFKNEKAHRRSSISALEHAISQQEDRYKFTLRDLVTVFFDISAHSSHDEVDGDEESDIGASPIMTGATGPQAVTRQSSVVRLDEEDRAWLSKRAHLRRMQKQAPAIKHFPGRKFFERIFNEISEGRLYLDKRRYAIAKAFVVIGLLAEQAGLETYCHWSSRGDQILCKIRAEGAELIVMADKQDYSLPISPHLDHRCPIPAHLEFDQNTNLDWLWQRHGVKLANGEHSWSRFRRVDRLKLIDAHIDDFVVLRRLIKMDLAVAFFPCDDVEEKLERDLHWDKPLDVAQIREYYGERIALYFAFLDHYKGSLMAISIIGVVVQFWQVAERYIPGLTSAETGIPVDIASLMFSAVIAVWGTLFLEFWKRKEATLTTQWGMTDFEAREEPRPEFIGEMRESATIGTLARRRADETGEDLEAKEWADNWREARGLHIRHDGDNSRVVDWYGKPKMWASNGTRKRRLMVTLTFVGGFLLLTLTATISIFIMRSAIRNSSAGMYTASVLGGVTNAFLIMSLQSVYDILTVVMTDWENWETQTEWQDSRAVKTFVFNFVNSFASFIYIAFWRKENDQGCMGACEHSTFASPIAYSRCPKVVAVLEEYSDGVMWPSNITFTEEYREYKGDCVLEMWIQLALIFMSKLIVGNILEVGLPVLKAKLNNDRVAKQRHEDLKAVESTKQEQEEEDQEESKANSLKSTDSLKHSSKISIDSKHSANNILPRLRSEINASKGDYDTFGDYAELIVQIGFLSLFVVCFPIAPMIAMLSNEAEVRIDLYKLLDMCKHPIPRGAQDIGKWQYFAEVTLYLAAMTNAGMFAFTTDVMASQTFNMKMIAFALFVAFVEGLKGLCAFLIPDVPEEIAVIQLRHKSLNDSLILGAELWDDDTEEHIDGEKFDVKIHWDSTPSTPSKVGIMEQVKEEKKPSSMSSMLSAAGGAVVGVASSLDKM